MTNGKLTLGQRDINILHWTETVTVRSVCCPKILKNDKSNAHVKLIGNNGSAINTNVHLHGHELRIHRSKIVIKVIGSNVKWHIEKDKSIKANLRTVEEKG